ncbi:hypothetical protein AMTRI_Chr08g166440 [Amborella trichopoda]
MAPSDGEHLSANLHPIPPPLPYSHPSPGASIPAHMLAIHPSNALPFHSLTPALDVSLLSCPNSSLALNSPNPSFASGASAVPPAVRRFPLEVSIILLPSFPPLSRWVELSTSSLKKPFNVLWWVFSGHLEMILKGHSDGGSSFGRNQILLVESFLREVSFSPSH